MDKVLQQVHYYNGTYSLYETLKDNLDLRKLSNDRLQNIVCPTNLSFKDFTDAISVSVEDQDKIELLLIKNSPQKHFIYSSDFKNNLGELAQRYCLNYLLKEDMTIDVDFLLLNKMKTVNYGVRSYNGGGDLETINPLCLCCKEGYHDRVQLLVEKYNADIEYLADDLTPIMYSARAGHLEITSYLYNKGAKLTTKLGKNIRNVTTDSRILKLVGEWECEEAHMNKQKDMEKDMEKYNEMKEKYDKLKSEFEKLKSTLDTIYRYN